MSYKLGIAWEGADARSSFFNGTSCFDKRTSDKHDVLFLKQMLRRKAFREEKRPLAGYGYVGRGRAAYTFTGFLVLLRL
ncbi:MAG: hypothetical protein ACRYG7_39145 [Janthinobacterium lividum]